MSFRRYATSKARKQKKVTQSNQNELLAQHETVWRRTRPQVRSGTYKGQMSYSASIQNPWQKSLRPPNHRFSSSIASIHSQHPARRSPSYLQNTSDDKNATFVSPIRVRRCFWPRVCYFIVEDPGFKFLLGLRHTQIRSSCHHDNCWESLRGISFEDYESEHQAWS